MAKNTGRSFARRASGRRGTVTVIEDHVSRSYRRNAKIAFWVITTVVGFLAATIIADYWHPIIALILGGALGAAIALPVAILIAIWPVLRVIIWWLPELATVAGLLYGFMLLVQHTTVQVRIGVVATILTPFAFPQVRHHVMKVLWCFISRHRLRTCFAEFVITGHRASLPFVLWARPTLVGEAVWLWLRPGLAISDLEVKLQQIASACWASKVTVEKASQANSAYVRVNISRRDALTGTVVSPLTDEIGPGDDSVPHPLTLAAGIGTDGLNLDDVTAESVTDTPKTTGKTGRTDSGKKPAPARDTVAVTPDAEDISDYI